MQRSKILLVDDVTLFLEMEKGFLQSSPVQILTAHNGEAALEIIRNEMPDLVLLDLNMPVMDGITCCSIIKADPFLKSIPVIIISNASREEDREICRQAGCDDFIAKPLDGRLFLEKTRRFIPSIERREIRVPCRMSVNAIINGINITGESLDISMHGLYLATNEVVAKGQAAAVSFRLPYANSPLYLARSRVAWLNSTPRKSKPNLPDGIGIQFIEITGEGLSMLRVNELRAFLQEKQKI